MGETIKTWTLRFPAKENPNVAKALLALLANRVTILRQGEVSVDFGHEVFPHERWLNKLLARGHNGHQPTHVDCTHGVIVRSRYPDFIVVKFH